MGLLCRAAIALILASAAMPADEGLWLFNRFPKAKVKDRYGVDVTDAFLKRLQLASVRFNSGGSGSFVSPTGLLFTNHHVGADCVQKLGTKQQNFLETGFYADSPDKELRCPDLEVNVLLKLEEITDQVVAGVPATATAAGENRARRANIARIEKECGEATGNRCDVVSLYSGSRYDLYQYKKYTDIRLVFVPEFAIAFFGGDPANFEFPRYCLDIAFFRAYDGGKPARPAAYLPFSKVGAKENEPTFVSGHPGSTERLATVANLEFVRDVQYPLTLRRLEGLMSALTAYGRKGPEQTRQQTELFFGAANSFKAINGFERGLKDPALLDRKSADERSLKNAVLSDPVKRQRYGQSWDALARAYEDARAYYRQYYCYEIAATGGSELAYFARVLTRLAEEDQKPNGERLKEYTDAARPQLEQMLYSPAPVHPELEVAVLEENLRFLEKELGSGDPVVRQILEGKTPRQVAEEAVKGSRLADIGVRKRLAEDHAALKAIQNDGVLRIVRILDGPARDNRKRYEDGVQAARTVELAKIARAGFAVRGLDESPDATFTLRLAYGPAKGYTDPRGSKIPWATRMGDVFEFATGEEPDKLPESWLRARAAIMRDRKSRNAPFNFVTTNDIHGGNSGSPTVNKNGEIVGIVFDGNRESFPNRYQYDDVYARSVHVTSQAVREALAKVYPASALRKELGF